MMTEPAFNGLFWSVMSIYSLPEIREIPRYPNNTASIGRDP